MLFTNVGWPVSMEYALMWNTNPGGVRLAQRAAFLSAGNVCRGRDLHLEMSQPGVVYAVNKGEKIAKERSYRLLKALRKVSGRQR